jgi:hypothetical protein
MRQGFRIKIMGSTVSSHRPAAHMSSARTVQQFAVGASSDIPEGGLTTVCGIIGRPAYSRVLRADAKTTNQLKTELNH